MDEPGAVALTPGEAQARLGDYGVTAVRRVRAGEVWLGLSPRHAVYLAASPAGVRSLRLESTRRSWAASLGVAVPNCLHEEPGLVVTDRVPADPLTDSAFVAAAVAVAEGLATAPEMPAGGFAASRGRRLRRPWTVPMRLLRGVRHQVPWAEFRAVRAEAERLPSDTLAHGDFQDDNLLWDAGRGRLCVIDWEYCALHPAGTDLLNLWVQMPEDDVRHAVLDAALRSQTTTLHAGVLAHWLALRHLAEVATGRPGEDGSAAWLGRLTNARRSLLRARDLRATLEGST